jgi:4,5-dihydroxyphthalate decarboxylase
MRVPLSLACGDYDRTAALARGDIRPEGVDLTYLTLPVEETFFQTLADMLASGEIDALYTPRVPRTFTRGRVRRLFADPRAEEERYFAATGIFPIMHVVVLRRDVYEQRPWLAQSLYKAFEQARQEAEARLAETAVSGVMQPWAYAEAQRTAIVMGSRFWSYGLAGNEAALRTFVRHAWEQGLIKTQPEPAALFAPETHEAYVI